MIHDLLRMGDARLRRVAPPVPATMFGTRELDDRVADMFETMHAAGGVGLAAPQIGINLQLVVFGFETSERYPEAEPVPRTVLINPVLTLLGEDTEDGWEGCLSIPGLRGMVPRHVRIGYRGLDQHGKPIEREASGFHARVVQHEIDHIRGRLYPSRITDFNQFGFVTELFPELDRHEAE